jgi:hypothetical protein
LAAAQKPRLRGRGVPHHLPALAKLTILISGIVVVVVVVVVCHAASCNFPTSFSLINKKRFFRRSCHGITEKSNSENATEKQRVK